MKKRTLAKGITIILLILIQSAYSAEYYTLQDDDVEVVDGVIVSSNYDTKYTDILVPEILDDQLVEAIGESAFLPSGITSIDLSNCSGLKEIGDKAFYRNDISEINLSNCKSLKRIGKYAFAENNNLYKFLLYNREGWDDLNVDFEGCDSLQIIDDYAFYDNCLTSVDFTDCSNLEFLGYKAFCGVDRDGFPSDSRLSSINLSNCTKLSLIEAYAFARNHALDGFELPNCSIDGFENWSSNNGKQYSAGDMVSDFTLYYYAFSYTLTDADVEVIDGVIVKCLYDYSNPAIIIPNILDGQEIIGIGDHVFENSSIFPRQDLVSVDFNQCTSLKSIGEESFYNNGIGYINLSACSALETIGIGAFGFNNCKTVNLSNAISLIEIKDRAFSTNSISSLNFSKCPQLKVIGAAAFDGTFATLDLSGCPSLEIIGQAAFGSCGIQEVNLSSCTLLKTIGDHAFEGNILAEVDLSECHMLTTIGFKAFYINDPLQSIKLPSCTLAGFENWCNRYGTILQQTDSIVDFFSSYHALVPYTLTDDDVVVVDGTIVSTSYDSCANVITIPDTLDGQAIQKIADTLNNIISKGVFEGLNIAKIILPTPIEFIGDATFHDNYLHNADFSLCASLQHIADAFGYNNFTNIDLSNCTSLVKIEQHAFFTWSDSLKGFTLPAYKFTGVNQWAGTDNNIYESGDQVSYWNGYNLLIPYTLTDADVIVENGEIINCSIDTLVTYITIPDTLDGQRMIGIDEGVFQNMNISKIDLPATIEYIGVNAFVYNDMQYITLPFDQNGNSVAWKYIDHYFGNDYTYESGDEMYNQWDHSLHALIPNLALELVDQDGVVLSDVDVLINDSLYTSDAEGHLLFVNMLAGEFEYIAITEGYKSSGTITLSSALIETPTIVFHETYNIEIITKGKNNDLIENATVVINDSEYISNSAGSILVDNLDSGLYTYSIDAFGYEEYNDSVEIIDADTIITITSLVALPSISTNISDTVCGTYSFAGLERNLSGIYTDTLTAMNGADSIVILSLTVNPNFIVSDSVSIEYGSTYNFGTQTITKTGQYVELFQSQSGCDSTVNLTLTVLPPPEVIIELEATACGSYEFNNKIVSETGIYKDTLSAQNGADSIIILALTVNSIFSIADSISIPYDSVYNFGAQILKEAGFYTEIYESANGCDSIVNISLTILPKENIETGTDYLSNTKKEIMLYPNPASEYFIAQSTNGMILSISVFDSSGRTVFENIYDSPNEGFLIDLKSQSSGIYTILIQTDNSSYSELLIKE